MVRYSSQNKSQSVSQWILVIAFGVLSLVFLVLPLFDTSIQGAWRWVSLSAKAVSSNNPQANDKDSCIVIATPPHTSFDTFLLECAPNRMITNQNFVWYVSDDGERYLVGRVTNNIDKGVSARLFTTSASNQTLDVRLGVLPEKYSALPLGGGSLRVEVPAEVEVKVGDKVRHAISNQLFGVVSGVRVEKGSYVKRIYIRVPFAFERVTQLLVE